MLMLRLKELIGLKIIFSVCSSFAAESLTSFDHSCLDVLHPHFRYVSKIDYLWRAQMSKQDLGRIIQVAQDNYYDNYLLTVSEKNHPAIIARDREALNKLKAAWIPGVLN